MTYIRNIILLLFLVLIGSIFFMISKALPEEDGLLAYQLNWDINIPTNGDLVYEKLPETSFHGDGLRYRILNFETFDISELGLLLNKDNSLETTLNKLLDTLEITLTNRPNFNQDYSWLKLNKNNTDTLILILDRHNNLYIIEQIF